MLIDLCSVNKYSEPLGSLQPCLSTPTMIPQDWQTMIIVLKDCFSPFLYNQKMELLLPLPYLHIITAVQTPDISGKFLLKLCLIALPCVNTMIISLCKLNATFPNIMAIHYMDDILFAQPDADIDINEISYFCFSGIRAYNGLPPNSKYSPFSMFQI